MHILTIQHLEFETPGYISDWADLYGHQLTIAKFYVEQFTIHPINFDLIIVLGGSMSANEIDITDWLIEEKNYLQSAIEQNIKLLGICLGSQILAKLLGSQINKNNDKEIGWFPVYNVSKSNSTLLNGLDDSYEVLHWHSDTFSLPLNSELIFSSTSCVHQGYIFQNRIVGLQFHPEITLKKLQDFAYNSFFETDTFVQSKEFILSNTKSIKNGNKLLEQILNNLTNG